jgi:cysteine-S-conjugate beta-lyase
VETIISRVGRCAAGQSGFINCSVYRASTALFDNFADAQSPRAEYWYGTTSNPTRANLEKGLMALTGCAGTLVLLSGAQAVMCTLMAVLSAGDNVFMMDTAYLLTFKFCGSLLSKKRHHHRLLQPLHSTGGAAGTAPQVPEHHCCFHGVTQVADV